MISAMSINQSHVKGRRPADNFSNFFQRVMIESQGVQDIALSCTLENKSYSVNTRLYATYLA